MGEGLDMWKHISALLVPLPLLFLLTPTFTSAEVKISGKTTVEPNKIVRLTADGDLTGTGLIWDVSDEDKVDAEEVGNKLLFAAPPGTYKVKLRTVKVKDGKTKVETTTATVVIGDRSVTSSASPIPAPGFRVLMVYETAELSNLPAAQQQVLYSKRVRDYLNAKCVTGSDHKTREYRIYDKDVDTSAESNLWQRAMKRPRASVPWVLVSNGVTGYEGPLPATVEDMMLLLKKYGD